MSSERDQQGPIDPVPPAQDRNARSPEALGEVTEKVQPTWAGPSFQGDEISPGRGEQLPLDLIDEESMESFPCSDPPSYSTCHA